MNNSQAKSQSQTNEKNNSKFKPPPKLLKKMDFQADPSNERSPSEIKDQHPKFYNHTQRPITEQEEGLKTVQQVSKLESTAKLFEEIQKLSTDPENFLSTYKKINKSGFMRFYFGYMELCLNPYLHKMYNFEKNEFGETEDRLNVKGVFLKSKQSEEYFQKNCILKFILNSLLVC